MRIFEEISQKPKKYASLFGGVLIMFCLGSISTLATMSPYYMSYLREYNELKRVRYSQTIWLQTCYTVNKLFHFQFIIISKLFLILVIIIILQIFVSVSATLAGVFKIRFKISSKKLAALGAILMRFIIFIIQNNRKDSKPEFMLKHNQSNP